MLAILGVLWWLEFFKTVYLETSNVRFGSFFQNPVTYVDASPTSITHIFNAEIFPPIYTVLRKGRVEGAGGVFICVEKNLDMSEMPELNTNAELIWSSS